MQEFIKEAGGADLRAFVVGGKVVAAMRRTSPPGEFRSNLHRGGTAELTRLSAKERATALKAARTMGLNMAGVDLLQSSRGPAVVEVNSSPGLEGIEKTSTIDVATRIIEFVEESARRRKGPGRGEG